MTEQAPTAASAPTTSIARSSAVVAAGTALSRITGLMRVAALAWAMGTGRLADWYNLANLGPNVIYELVLGGVLSAALVPLLTEFRNNDDPESESIVMSTTVVGAGLLTLLALLGARGGEAILTAMTDHVTAVDRARLDTLFSLMALLFPQIFFYALNTMMTARLNAARVFGPAAFTPVFTNVLTTAAAIAAGL
ncbi:MAG TPA: lipid II flippase MurJ, partial [Microthrixaceae bacterium]|nr:lipid II flippase MurJ [Microthrixaceae bacterium]